MIFNTLYSAKANPFTTAAETSLAIDYENYITEHFEREAFQLVDAICIDIRKAGINDDCIGFEIDLFNDGGKCGMECYAKYQLQIGGKLTKLSRKKVWAIYEKRIATIPIKIDLLDQFKKSIQCVVDEHQTVSAFELPKVQINE